MSSFWDIFTGRENTRFHLLGDYVREIQRDEDFIRSLLLDTPPALKPWETKKKYNTVGRGTNTKVSQRGHRCGWRLRSDEKSEKRNKRLKKRDKNVLGYHWKSQQWDKSYLRKRNLFLG